MANQFAGMLLGSNGRPIEAPKLASQEPGTVEQLRKLRADYDALFLECIQKKEDFDALKAEHDEVLKDIGAIADSHQELKSQHEALKELHVVAMDKIASADLHVCPGPVEKPTKKKDKSEAPASDPLDTVA